MSDNQKLPPFRTLQFAVPETTMGSTGSLMGVSSTGSPKITLPPINNLNLPMKQYHSLPPPTMLMAASAASSSASSGYTYTLSNSQLMSPKSQTQSSPNTPHSPIQQHDTDNDDSDHFGSQDLGHISATSTPETDYLNLVSNPHKVRKVLTDFKSSSALDPVYPSVHPALGSDSDGESQSEATHKENTIGIRKWKPRKKRQCPDCKLFFSNLATHKSTHLNPDSRPHICEYCSRGFARPNDLFRHVKCHWKEIGSDKGQFKCPYKNHSTGDHCGHNSGIFSRCDTFKNHLKAIHFQYPSGTKKDQRSKSSGSCRICQHQFDSVDDWLNNHIENNQCPYANDFKKT